MLCMCSSLHLEALHEALALVQQRLSWQPLRDDALPEQAAAGIEHVHHGQRVLPARQPSLGGVTDRTPPPLKNGCFFST